MPAIPKSGLLPKNPFRPDSGQAVTPKEIVENEPYHGLIDLTDLIGLSYMFVTGHKLKRGRDKDGRVIYERTPDARGAGEPRDPPAPRAGGPYVAFRPFNYESDTIPDSAFSTAYRNMLNYNLSRGRIVSDRADPDDELFRKWGTDACEYRFVGDDGREYQGIKISRGVSDIRKRFKRLSHETTGADLFEGLPRHDGDHEAREDEIIDGADELAAKYLADALRHDARMRRN